MSQVPDDDRDERSAARERQSRVRHDLRAPLAVIYPILSMLADDGLTPRQLDYLERLERQMTRLERMIGSVADSGWADCSAAPAARRPVRLDELVDELVRARRFAERQDAAGVSPRLIAEVADGLPPVLADPDHLRQVLADLVSNAEAFTPATGSIRVSAARGDAPDSVLLRVADDGCGIPADELPHVTEFAYRGAAAPQQAGGLGLGLWVCERLLELNEASLAVVSEPGSGTTVTVTLVAAPAG